MRNQLHHNPQRELPFRFPILDAAAQSRSPGNEDHGCRMPVDGRVGLRRAWNGTGEAMGADGVDVGAFCDAEVRHSLFSQLLLYAV